MNILLTGAFGNIGTSFIKNFISRKKPGYSLRCFGVKKKSNLKKSAMFGRKVEIFWGDIRNPDNVFKAVEGQDVIIHLAFVVPPLSEKNPDFAHNINIDGTKNILEAIKLQKNKTRIVFGSSISVFGPVAPGKKPPIKAEDDIKASDNYTSHKIECEKMVMQSGLDWIITRFGAVPPMIFSKEYIPMLFEVPLNSRIECIHTMDVGLALLNTVDCKQCSKKILLIGGGKRCQIYQRELLTKFLGVYGFRLPPDSAFSTVPYYLDWLDTRESQELLQYQTRTFDDFINDLKKTIGFKRYFMRFLRPVVQKFLLARSPYYQE